MKDFPESVKTLLLTGVQVLNLDLLLTQFKSMHILKISENVTDAKGEPISATRSALTKEIKSTVGNESIKYYIERLSNFKST